MKVMALKIFYSFSREPCWLTKLSYYILTTYRDKLFSKLNNVKCLVGSFQILISKTFFSKPDFVKIVKPYLVL